MSEETPISSGMETAEISVDSNQSDKTMHHHTCSPLLNFSISRLLSGGDRKNNNHIATSKHSSSHHHRHTIHYHGTMRDPSEELEDERLEESRRRSRAQSRSPTTDRLESDSEVDVRNSEDSEVEMDDADDSCSNNNNSSVGNNNNRSGSSGSKSVDHDNDYRHGSPGSKTGDGDCGNSNRSTPDSQNAHGAHQQHPHLESQLSIREHQHAASLHSANEHLRSSIENLSSNCNNHDSPTSVSNAGQTLGGVNPFPMFGYSSIFLPNFPCPITSPNQVIRVPAHRPMSNFQLFGQSALGQHSPLDLNATPLFSNFDPRNSLLLKDRLHGKSQ